MNPRPEWNVILRGGPHDGMMLFLPVPTLSVIEGGVGGAPVLGAYHRTEEVEEARDVFRWADSGTDRGSDRPAEPPDRAQHG